MSDDEIIPLSIAILAGHELPAGEAEKIAATVLTHLRAEGWRAPGDGPVLSARRSLRLFMGRDPEEPFSLSEIVKRMPLPSHDVLNLNDGVTRMTIEDLRWLRHYWTHSPADNSQMVVAWIEAEIARRTSHD